MGLLSQVEGGAPAVELCCEPRHVQRHYCKAAGEGVRDGY